MPHADPVYIYNLFIYRSIYMHVYIHAYKYGRNGSATMGDSFKIGQREIPAKRGRPPRGLAASTALSKHLGEQAPPGGVPVGCGQVPDVTQ